MKSRRHDGRSRAGSAAETGNIVTPAIVIALGSLSGVTVVGGAALISMYADHPIGPWTKESAFAAVSLMLIAVQTAVVLKRERNPLPPFIVSVCIATAITLMFDNRALAQTPLFVFSVVSFAAHTAGRRLWLPIAGAVLVDIASQLLLLMDVDHRNDIETDPTLAVVSILLNIAITYTVYLAIGRITAVYRRRLVRLDREHERQLKESLVAERHRMARELHDITAHHLTAIVIQAKAANLIRESSPENLPEILQTITDQASKSLNGLRQIVGVLRLENDDSILPQPMISDLDELMIDFEQQLPEIEFRKSGPLEDLDAVVQLSCYRIVQESMSNVARHAPGAPVTVTLTRDGSHVEIEVINGPATAQPRSGGQGFGLIGMNERAELFGGRLEGGPTLDGGWRVFSVLSTESRLT